MKATGIVRRIDDLGRVVIPKEIRRTMKIREGAPLEIFTDAGGSVIFRKYSQVGEESGAATQMCEAMYKTSGRSCAICDLDSVVAASGPRKRDLDGKALSPDLEQAMQQRQLITKPRGGLEVAPGAPAACCTKPRTANATPFHTMSESKSRLPLLISECLTAIIAVNAGTNQITTLRWCMRFTQ